MIEYMWTKKRRNNIIGVRSKPLDRLERIRDYLKVFSIHRDAKYYD